MVCRIPASPRPSREAAASAALVAAQQGRDELATALLLAVFAGTRNCLLLPMSPPRS